MLHYSSADLCVSFLLLSKIQIHLYQRMHVYYLKDIIKKVIFNYLCIVVVLKMTDDVSDFFRRFHS